MLIHNNFFRRSILTHAVGQTDLDFGMWSGFIGVQDYKSLCAAVTIYYTLVNIQTHIHTHREHFDQLTWKARPDELKTPQVTLIYNWQCDSEAVTFLGTPTVSPSGAIVQALFIFIVLLCVVGSSLTTAVLSVCLVAAGGGEGGMHPGRHCAGRVENMEFQIWPLLLNWRLHCRQWYFCTLLTPLT